MKKLSVYDKNIKEFATEITPYIEKFVNLQDDNVKISDELYEKLKIFIKDIRMENEIKTEILNSFL